MPRAIDPSLPAGGLPITHNPLSRIRYDTTPQKFSLEKVIADIFGVQPETGGLLDLFNLDDIFGFIGGIFTSIFQTPIGNIVDIAPNLLPYPLFNSPRWIPAGVTDWAIDNTVTSVTGGASLRVAATGVEHSLLNPNLISVSIDQVIAFSVETKWQALVATGEPIQLLVAAFTNGVPATENTTVLLESEGGGSNSDWVTLSGNYTVPEGVDAVKMLLRVTASAASGTVWFSNGSVTKPRRSGVLPLDFIQGLQDALAGIDEFVQSVIDFILEVIEGIPFFGGTLADLFETLLSWFDDTQTTAAQSSDNAGDIQETIDRIVQGAGNVLESGFGFGTLFQAIRDHTTQITDLNAGLAALKADQQGQIVSGKSFTVNFHNHPNAATPPSMFTKVADSGAGSIVVDDGELKWSGGTVVGREWYRYNVEALLTDYFEVSAIIPKRSAQGLLGNTGNAYHYLLGRMNSAGTTACVCRIGRDETRIGCIVAGSTTMANPTWFGGDVDVEPPAGSYVTFRGGVLTGSRIFQMLVNNQIKATFTDAGNVSVISDLHRWVGLGLEADDVFLVGYEPGTIGQWTANDNVQPPVVGSTARMYRSSTTNITMNTASGASQTLPASFFGVIDYASPDIIVNLARGSFEVTRDGTYSIRMRAQAASVFKSATATGTGHTVTPLLFVNDIPKEDGNPASSAVDGFNNPIGSNALYSTWDNIYLHAGDEVQVGYRNDRLMDASVTYHRLAGEATGTKTLFSIALQNWNTL